MEFFENYLCFSCRNIVPVCNRNIHEARCHIAQTRNLVRDPNRNEEISGTELPVTENSTALQYVYNRNFRDAQSSENTGEISNWIDTSHFERAPLSSNSLRGNALPTENVTNTRNRFPVNNSPFANASMRSSWACQECTFDNNEHARKCEMCSNPRQRCSPPITPPTFLDRNRSRRRGNSVDTSDRQRISSQQWICAHCTCNNDLQIVQCAVCDNPHLPDSSYHETLLGEQMSEFGEAFMPELESFDHSFYLSQDDAAPLSEQLSDRSPSRLSQPSSTPPMDVTPVRREVAIGAPRGGRSATVSGRYVSRGSRTIDPDLRGTLGNMHVAQNPNRNTDRRIPSMANVSRSRPPRDTCQMQQRMHVSSFHVSSQLQNMSSDSSIDIELDDTLGSHSSRIRVSRSGVVDSSFMEPEPDDDVDLQQILLESVMGPTDAGPFLMGPNNMDRRMRGRDLRYMQQFGMGFDRRVQSRDESDGSELDFSYEGLLARFPPSTAQPPALSAIIASLPTHTRTGNRANNENRDDECAICLDSFAAGQQIKTLPCLHLFHTNCVDEWLKTSGTCPVCKTALS